MIKIYNATTEVYQTLEDYLGSIDTSVAYYVVFAYDRADLFDKVKQMSAYRGKNVKDKEGKRLLENIAMTTDEQELFDRYLLRGVTNIFKSIGGFAKNIENALQMEGKIGLVTYNGTVISIMPGDVILTVFDTPVDNDILIGSDIIITSGTEDGQRRDIVANSGVSIQIDSAFNTDVTGETYDIFDPEGGNDHVLVHINLSDKWDLNMLQGADAVLEDAIISFILYNWFSLSGADIFVNLELSNFQEQKANLKSHLMHQTTPSRRPASFF